MLIIIYVIKFAYVVYMKLLFWSETEPKHLKLHLTLSFIQMVC